MKKKISAAAAIAVAILLVFSIPGHLTRAQAPSGVTTNFSNVGGLYLSAAYSAWGGEIISGNSATGSQTILICVNPVLSNGRSFNPLQPANSAFAPINIDPQSSTQQEVVTPTAFTAVPTSTIPQAPSTQVCGNVTATFSNTHAAGSLNTSQVLSGDQGIQEALNDASLNGGGLVYWTADTGNVTLNTAGLTTTTTTKVPANFISAGAAARVTTTITVTASWAVGISGSTSAFTTANSTLTAGTTAIANMNSPATVGTTTGLTAILITGATSNPGAGAVHVRVWGYTAAQPTF
jgi:hypothetical protein